MMDRNKFVFIEYNGVSYPAGFNSYIKEFVAHLVD